MYIYQWAIPDGLFCGVAEARQYVCGPGRQRKAARWTQRDTLSEAGRTAPGQAIQIPTQVKLAEAATERPSDPPLRQRPTDRREAGRGQKPDPKGSEAEIGNSEGAGPRTRARQQQEPKWLCVVIFPGLATANPLGPS